MSAFIALVEITSEVVLAYLVQNHIPPSEVPALIAAVHATFAGLGMSEPASEWERRKPHASIPKFVTDKYIISLEDGKRYKSLKRRLSSRGITPEVYRAKWDLPSDYSMIASVYARQRSELARRFGFGSLHRWA